MQCIYFAAKKYMALSIYPDLYQLVDFHRNNSKIMKLCDTSEALQLPSLSMNMVHIYQIHLPKILKKQLYM